MTPNYLFATQPITQLIDAVVEENVNLTKIILTHGHMDHVGGVGELSTQRSLPIEGPHKEDLFWISALDQQAQMMGFAPVPNFTPTRWLNDGDTVRVGEVTFDVLHCPGHTPGHVVLYEKSTSTAFVGDVLFHGSIGRTDFPLGNHQQLIDSIREKLWPLGDNVTFIPGHGPNSTFGVERRTNPFVADKKFG